MAYDTAGMCLVLRNGAACQRRVGRLQPKRGTPEVRRAIFNGMLYKKQLTACATKMRRTPKQSPHFLRRHVGGDATLFRHTAWHPARQCSQ